MRTHTFLNKRQKETRTNGRIRLLPLQALLPHRKRLLEQLLLFLDVHRLDTRGDGRARRTARVHDMATVVVLGGIKQGFNAWLDEAPCTRVQGLFLRPDDGLGVRVHVVQVVTELRPRERVELLDTGDGDVAQAEVGTVLDQRGVDLAGAENDALDLLGGVDLARGVGGVGDDPLEVRVAGEFIQVGAGDGVTEQGLGEEEDQSWNMLVL